MTYEVNVSVSVSVNMRDLVLQPKLEMSYFAYVTQKTSCGFATHNYHCETVVRGGGVTGRCGCKTRVTKGSFCGKSYSIGIECRVQTTHNSMNQTI